MAKQKVTHDDLVKMFEKKGGNISAACSALNITRQTFFNYRNSSKELADRLDNVTESLIDFAESKLTEQINDGNLTAIIFYLKTKGRNRGYVERVENEMLTNPFEDLMKRLDDEEDDKKKKK